MYLNIPWDLFAKPVKNELEENEHRELVLWKDRSQVNTLIFQEIIEDENIKTMLVKETWKHHSKDWDKILAKIKHPSKKIFIKKRSIRSVAAVAAVFIVAISVFAALQYHQIKRVSQSETYTYVFSPRGQRTQLILPDQTKVWLNGESSIKYPLAYNLKNRQVKLEGEAYFEVTKDPNSPFTVNANEIDVKVYGTAFNLKAFPGEKYIETTLIEGKLSVIPVKNKGNQVKEIFLKPKEKLIYEKSSREITSVIQSPDSETDKNEKVQEKISGASDAPKIVIEKKPDIEEEKNWKDGKLIFKNETFEELAVRMERWYDVKIHFMDESVKNYVFTGAFEKETINQAMEALLLSSKKSYKYRMEFRDIYIKK